MVASKIPSKCNWQNLICCNAFLFQKFKWWKFIHNCLSGAAPTKQSKNIPSLGVWWGNYTTLWQNHECTSYNVLSADCRWSRLNRTLSHNSAASVGQTSTARRWHNLLMTRPQWHLPVNHSHVKQQSQKYCKNNVGNTAKSNNFFCTSDSVCLLTLCALQMMVLLLLQATIAFSAIVAWTVVYESRQSTCTGRWESPESMCTARCAQLCGIQRPRLACPAHFLP